MYQGEKVGTTASHNPEQRVGSLVNAKTPEGVLGALPMEIGELDTSISDIGEQIYNLQHRLQPVLTPQPTGIAQSQDESPQPVLYSEQIAFQVGRINRLRTVLSDIRSQLEV